MRTHVGAHCELLVLAGIEQYHVDKRDILSDLDVLRESLKHLISLDDETPRFRVVCDIGRTDRRCDICGGRNLSGRMMRGTTYHGDYVYFHPGACERELYDQQAYGRAEPGHSLHVE